MKLLIALVVAVALGIATGTIMKSGNGHSARTPTKTADKETIVPATPQATDVSAPSMAESTEVVPASFPEAPAVKPSTTWSARNVASYCDALNLVAHPEKAPEMVILTSAVYGTPAGLQNGIWETESDHGINGQTGTCSVMRQYAIRDCWKPGTTTRRPRGCTSPYIFAVESPSETRWKPLPRRRVGNGTAQKRAIIRIARALGIDAWSIKGSCGNRSLTGLRDPAKSASHGGCFGNMQITPTEWERDVRTMGFGLSELSPFNLCDSMLVSSYRLRKHHDQRYARYMKSARWRTQKQTADQLSWLWAGRRYYGNPEGRRANSYERHNKWGRGNPRRMDIFAYLAKRPRSSQKFPCGWACWDAMSEQGDFSPLIDHIRWRGRKERGRLLR